MVKYVVKEILPHFQETIKSGDWGNWERNREVCNISGSRTDLMLQLPNQARYQLRYTRIFNFCHYTTAGRKIKDFLSVVIPVVKAAFVPFSAIG